MFTSINPATGEPGKRFAELTDDGVEAKVALAHATYVDWRVTDLSTRTAMLYRIADRFEADKRRLAEIATREMGKTLKSALAEVEKCVAGFRYYAEHGPVMLAPVAFAGGSVWWLPIGPVLAVMP